MYAQAKVNQIVGDIYQVTPNTWKFKSSREFHVYCDEHPEAIDTISPGGAAACLGVSRQRVYDLIEQGVLRAWFIYEPGLHCNDVRGNRASYVFVFDNDVQRYKISPRKPGRRFQNKG